MFKTRIVWKGNENKIKQTDFESGIYELVFRALLTGYLLKLIQNRFKITKTTVIFIVETKIKFQCNVFTGFVANSVCGAMYK